MNAPLNNHSPHHEYLRKDVDQLLQIVRDGTGGPSLVNRVQSLEKDFNYSDNRLSEIRKDTTTTSEQLTVCRNFVMDLRKEFDQLKDETEKKQANQAASTVKVKHLVIGAIITVLTSLVSNYVLNHRVVPKQSTPSGYEQPTQDQPVRKRARAKPAPAVQETDEDMVDAQVIP